METYGSKYAHEDPYLEIQKEYNSFSTAYTDIILFGDYVIGMGELGVIWYARRCSSCNPFPRSCLYRGYSNGTGDEKNDPLIQLIHLLINIHGDSI